MKSYPYDNIPGDQRLPHEPAASTPLSPAYLSTLGVHYHLITDAADLEALAARRGYKNRDEVTVSPDAMGAVYEDKVRMFFNEHMHEDEEIRYIVDGSGFFDVRDQADQWVRIWLEKDDLIVLPAGVYHRFTTDEKNVSLLPIFFSFWLTKANTSWSSSISKPCASSKTSRNGRR